MWHNSIYIKHLNSGGIEVTLTRKRRKSTLICKDQSSPQYNPVGVEHQYLSQGLRWKKLIEGEMTSPCIYCDDIRFVSIKEEEYGLQK